MNGEKHLSEQELLAILLRTGKRGENVITLAGSLLKNFGSLKNIANAGVREIAQISGIGSVKAITIKAAFELCRRLEIEKNSYTRITSPGDVFDFIRPHIWNINRETLAVIILNSKNKIIRWEILGMGSGNGITITPREIFITAIKEGGISIILAHNHPSGDPTPSRADIEFTRRIKTAGEIVGIALLDHIIVGEDRFVSLKQQGVI